MVAQNQNSFLSSKNEEGRVQRMPQRRIIVDHVLFVVEDLDDFAIYRG